MFVKFGDRFVNLDRIDCAEFFVSDGHVDKASLWYGGKEFEFRDAEAAWLHAIFSGATLDPERWPPDSDDRGLMDVVDPWKVDLLVEPDPVATPATGPAAPP